MPTASPKVLYVDDDSGLCRLVGRGLTRMGYEVESAANGESGVERIRAAIYDVVVLDHYMPGMDGLATLAAIHEMAEPPPVIFATGAQESQIAVAALKAGAADYVIKDTQGEFVVLLAAAIEQALASARLRRAKEDAEAELRDQRDRFETLAAERALLLREVNHRVGNSLQLIAAMLHMQSNAAGTDDIKAALATAMNRVMAVAQVHKRLYTSDDVTSVSLDQYLEALLDDLKRSADGGNLDDLVFASNPIETEPDRAVSVGVIVTELVINALKYAYPTESGPIRVGLHAAGPGRARLTVEDDGVGHSPAPVKSGRKSGESGLGQIIVGAMATKLGAEVSRDTSHAGTKVVIVFDLAAPVRVERPRHAGAA